MPSSTSSTLLAQYPWTTKPLIANAPMAGFACAPLALAVYRARGLGFIGSAYDIPAVATQLAAFSQSLFSSPTPPANTTLPVGVGFLTFLTKPATVLPIVEEYRPAAVWLFAARELADYVDWVRGIRRVSGETKVWIQIGSVAGALRVMELCSPDVLVMQGTDAGGHGWEKGAGVISLVPETKDALVAQGWGHVPLIAAGGIADGRGLAAALTLGADGVVMGTRFLAARETTLPHEGYADVILTARDGGQNTVRAKVFDELKGENMWPALFDGRGVVTDSYRDHVKEVPIEELRRLYKEAGEGIGGGFGVENGRTTVWAGTGVGLVRERMGAGEIVEETREGAQKALVMAKAYL